MRKTSEAVLELLTQDEIRYYHIVKIGPFVDENGATTTWLHTPVPGGIQIGTEYYTDDNALVHIDPPRQTASIDREAFKLSYADPNFMFRALFEKGVTGIPVEIKIGFFNTLMYPLGGQKVNGEYPNGVMPGHPLNDPDDLMVIYAGRLDSPSYSIDLGAETLAVFECTSPMGAITMKKPILTSKEALRKRHPTDSAYDQLFKGSKGIVILWGKT